MIPAIKGRKRVRQNEIIHFPFVHCIESSTGVDLSNILDG